MQRGFKKRKIAVKHDIATGQDHGGLNPVLMWINTEINTCSKFIKTIQQLRTLYGEISV